MKKKLQKVSLVVSGLALAATLTAFFSVSFAWFTHKRDAAILKPETTAVAQYQVSYLTFIDNVQLSGSNIEYHDLFPGQKEITIRFEITNTGELATNLNLAFLSPTPVQEVPFIDEDGLYGVEGFYYYFGSQIKIENISAKVNDADVSLINPVSDFLVETTPLGSGQVNGVAAEVAISELEILEDTHLEVGDVLKVEYTLLFVDNGTNQNVYMDAWPTDGVSSRDFKIHLKEGNP